MRVWVTLLLGMMLVGCSGAPDKSPLQESLDLTRSRVDSGFENANDAAEGLDAYTVQLRYNPARCDCPDYEVEVYGRWVRAFVTGPPTLLNNLERFAEDVAQGQRRSDLEVKGRMAGERKAATRVVFPEFELLP